jgi:anionic cell wall polymer biosynthesis LytR-Cps2A-Psr (LCP) family protein
MFDPVSLFALDKIKDVAKKVTRSKWLYVFLFVAAIAGGTYFYLNHSTNQQVNSAVKNVNANATIKTFETKKKIDDATAVVDEKFERRRAATQKEYHSVRTTIIQAPSSDRDAPASPVVLDTLNRLERMRAGEQPDAGGVPDAEVPVG